MSEKTKSRIGPINTENKLMATRARGGGMGKIGEGKGEIQVSSYGMNTSWE